MRTYIPRPITNFTAKATLPFIFFSVFFTLLATVSSLFLGGCNGNDYNFIKISGDKWDRLGLTKFRDCSGVLGDNYWYEEHELGVVIFYGPCIEDEHLAYTMIDTEFFEMDGTTTVVQYESPSGAVYNVRAWEFTLDLWYNPVDIELDIIPYQEDFALGIHTFRIRCEDDDQLASDIEHLHSLSYEDFDFPEAEE